MTEKDIDIQVAELIDALQLNETQSLPSSELPNNDFFFSLTEDDYEQVIGHQVGKWRVDKLLGVGGMSVVYQVTREDEHIEQKGALKVISDRYVYSSFKDRFLKERQILTDLNHPNIVKLLDAGITNTGIPWYVMEYIEGSDIKTYVSENKLNHSEIIELILRVCDALICAHQFDVVHRDVKPSNVIISNDGQVKLFDFGIAHINDDNSLSVTKTGVIIGTPGYMSPEQAKGQTDQINQSTDVFAMGVMLCELLTGDKPFQGDDITEISYATIHHEPKVKTNTLAKDIIAVIFKCLHKNPAKRYLSVSELKQDLCAFQASEVVSAQRITWRYRFKKLIQRHPISSALVTVLVSSILISVAYGIHQFFHNQKQLLFTEQVVNQANQINTKINEAHLLPLHNVQTTYEDTSTQAENLEEQLTSNKDLAGGSAYTALGMTYLNMRNPPKAKLMFEQAELLGHQSSTLSRGLGIVLSGDWRLKMSQKPNTEETEQLKIEIYQPMMAHFEAAKQDDDFQYFISGNMAYLDKDYEVAIEHFDMAFQQNNGFYDALRMKSETQLRQFESEVRTAGYVKSLPMLKASNKTLEQAIEIGRSDPFNYISLCSNKAAEIQILAFTKQLDDLADNIDSASEVCANALELDPDAKTPWANRSFILLSSLSLLTNNDEKSNLYQEVIDWIDQATMKHPEDERLYLSKVRPLMGLADIAIESDSDPLPFFKLALNTLDEVKRINSTGSERRRLNETARVNFSIANYHNSLEQHETAIQHFQLSIDAYNTSYDMQNDNIMLLNIGLTEFQMYKNHRAIKQHDAALKLLQQSLERRLPLFAEQLDSYYSAFIDVLPSILELIEYESEHNFSTNTSLNDFEKHWHIACDFEEKTNEQADAINSLLKRYATLKPNHNLEPCQINP